MTTKGRILPEGSILVQFEVQRNSPLAGGMDLESSIPVWIDRSSRRECPHCDEGEIFTVPLDEAEKAHMIAGVRKAVIARSVCLCMGRFIE